MHTVSSRPKFQTLRVIFALMVREMATRYGRSWGGYFWALAEPVGTIAILSLAFSQFIRTPALGDSFMLFYARKHAAAGSRSRPLLMLSTRAQAL